jgi:acyl-CoA reductase-like NAD-dependent aldehyde dehydrogenase
VAKTDNPDDLEAAFAAYKAAAAAWRIASSGRVRSDHLDACAERLVRARVALYEQLTAGGWAPPEPVSIQLERDRALVALPDDLDALLTVGG